ncbi:MAG: bifunctional riboflavin kinase/FAD synthetase [Anaerolineae bacterium]|nr:bifunctional riboflavin kinase/FAD synthetase [Anaerolineae bacterium]
MHVLTTEIGGLSLPEELAGRESAIAVGAFDGIHLGHQELIRRLVALARREQRLAGLVTFYPHPAMILRPRQEALYLTTPGEKAALLEPLGLDWMVVVSFTPQLAKLSPGDFLGHLYDRVGMRALCVGPDFALGRDRSGDLSALRELGRELGFCVHDVPYITQGEDRISSTQIRTLVRRGHVDQAAHLLGRFYAVAGEVVRGAQRGRCLGYPTANVAVNPDRVVPADGIYATYARLGKACFGSVTSIGVRPTFDNGMRSVEVHLFDFEGDLYGRDLVVEFVARLRPEKRFPSPEALVAQIDQDAAQARAILNARSHG